MKPLPILLAVSIGLFTGIADVGAQVVSNTGISNARDSSGNLVERGAATRSYPVAPMANCSIVRRPPVGYVVIAHGRTVMIRPRQ